MRPPADRRIESWFFCPKAEDLDEPIGLLVDPAGDWGHWGLWGHWGCLRRDERVGRERGVSLSLIRSLPPMPTKLIRTEGRSADDRAGGEKMVVYGEPSAVWPVTVLLSMDSWVSRSVAYFYSGSGGIY